MQVILKPLRRREGEEEKSKKNGLGRGRDDLKSREGEEPSCLCVFCLCLQVAVKAITGERVKKRGRSAAPGITVHRCGAWSYASPVTVARGMMRHQPPPTATIVPELPLRPFM